MKLNLKRAFVPLLSVALLGATILSAMAQDLEQISVRLAWIAGGVDAPFFMAESKGYFTEAGLDVEIVDGNGSTGTIQAVGNGDFEVGIAGLGVLAQAQQQADADTMIAVAGLLQRIRHRSSASKVRASPRPKTSKASASAPMPAISKTV